MLYKKFILALIVLTAFVGCSKKETPQPQKTEPENSIEIKNTETETQQKQEIDISKIELTAPKIDKNKIAVPNRLSAVTLASLQPEDMEAAVLRSFSAQLPADDAQVNSVKMAADQGNHEAIEKLALYYLAFPPTDDRHQEGINYIKKIEDYQSIEALVTRGMIEYGNIIENAPKAKPYFEKALQKDDVSVLHWLIEHEDIGLFDQAWEKLIAVYQEKADKSDPEALFELARLYDLYPTRRDLEKSKSLLLKASELGLPKAIYVHGLLAIHENHPEEAINLLRKASELKVDEANDLLALLYFVAILKSDPKEASEYANQTITPEMLQTLKSEFAGEKGKETIGDYMKIAQYASLSNGQEQSCRILFALSAAGDWASPVKEAAIGCLEKYIEKNNTRLACDNIDNLVPFSDESVYSKTFSPEQKQKISKIRMDCYKNMLASGLDYVTENKHVFASATKLAMIYDGEVDESIPQDKMLSAQYLIYAARKNGDIIAQMTLALDYFSGNEWISQNTKRGCYWSKKANSHPMCTDLCKLTRTEEGEALVLDENMNVDDVEAAMMVCGICKNARDMIQEYCGGL